MQNPGPFRKSVAVVIGINTYSSGIAELRTAGNDARRLGEILRGQHGYEVIELLDGAATKARITTLLTDELPASIGEDDRVLFYFAGHGVARDSDEGPDGYLLPVDSVRGDEESYLHMPMVHNALLALTCRHMLVVLDSCFSGAFRWSATRDLELEIDVVHQEKYERFVRDPAWQVITSASQDEKALDQLLTGALGSRDGDAPHSPFALAFFDALGSAADIIPRDGGDGLVTATELYLYLEDTLQKATASAGKQQTPRLWPLSKHDKGEYVFFVPGRDLALPPAPELTFENNPWRGLSSYESKDAPLFFGREAETAALCARIEAHPLTVVVGTSGAGKSSLVKAGVLPKLAAAGWLTLPPMRPGAAPLSALAQSLGVAEAALRRVTADTVTAAMQQLLAAHTGQHVLLVIEQFEEFVTLVRSGQERDGVLALLATLLKTHAAQLHVVVTIRTDFEPNFDTAAFGDLWRDNRYLLLPMSRENLRAVIEKPAAAKVVYFNPSKLVETLLDEIAAAPGALPLLSFALSEMYIRYVKRQSGDRAITQADYTALGGVGGALRARIELEFASLDRAQQETLRRVMLRLVTTDGGGVARRRALDTELRFANPAENARAVAVVARLTAARLLVEGREPDGDAFVEPAHDSLVRTWGRLLQWVREENESEFPLTQQQRLGRSAVEWEHADESAKSGLLWSDASRSQQLVPLVRTKAPFFNERELAFAKQSVRRGRIRQAITYGVTALVAVSGIFSTVQWRRAEAQRADANRQRAIAEEQRAAAVAEKERALRSLFSSLSVSMFNGNPGSVCVRPLCSSAPPTGSGAWVSLARLPESLEFLPQSLEGDGSQEKTRDFIVASDDSAGHVLVYAHDGLVQDGELDDSKDNLLFAENALRWLGASASRDVAPPAGCAAGPPIVLVWEGSFVTLDRMRAVLRSIEKRGWRSEAVDLETFAQRLPCAAVLWYISDWKPRSDFATVHVPMIKQFVRRGGGLLVGGLGWSYWQFPHLHPAQPDGPYAADLLGKAFGFSFTRDAFRAPKGERVELLGAQ